jgi:hypothetical protein
LLIAIVGVILAFRYRKELFGLDVPVRVGCVIALVVLGWAFARAAGRAVGPTLFRRMDPGTAGTTPVRDKPHIGLEEVDAERIVVRVAATPMSDDDGPQLADEVLATVAKGGSRLTFTPSQPQTLRSPPPSRSQLQSDPR